MRLEGPKKLKKFKEIALKISFSFHLIKKIQDKLVNIQKKFGDIKIWLILAIIFKTISS